VNRASAGYSLIYPGFFGVEAVRRAPARANSALPWAPFTFTRPYSSRSLIKESQNPRPLGFVATHSGARFPSFLRQHTIIVLCAAPRCRCVYLRAATVNPGAALQGVHYERGNSSTVRGDVRFVDRALDPTIAEADGLQLSRLSRPRVLWRVRPMAVSRHRTPSGQRPHTPMGHELLVGHRLRIVGPRRKSRSNAVSSSSAHSGPRDKHLRHLSERLIKSRCVACRSTFGPREARQAPACLRGCPLAGLVTLVAHAPDLPSNDMLPSLLATITATVARHRPWFGARTAGRSGTRQEALRSLATGRWFRPLAPVIAAKTDGVRKRIIMDESATRTTPGKPGPREVRGPRPTSSRSAAATTVSARIKELTDGLGRAFGPSRRSGSQESMMQAIHSTRAAGTRLGFVGVLYTGVQVNPAHETLFFAEVSCGHGRSPLRFRRFLPQSWIELVWSGPDRSGQGCSI